MSLVNVNYTGFHFLQKVATINKWGPDNEKKKHAVESLELIWNGLKKRGDTNSVSTYILIVYTYSTLCDIHTLTIQLPWKLCEYIHTYHTVTMETL